MTLTKEQAEFILEAFGSFCDANDYFGVDIEDGDLMGSIVDKLVKEFPDLEVGDGDVGMEWAAWQRRLAERSKQPPAGVLFKLQGKEAGGV